MHCCMCRNETQAIKWCDYCKHYFCKQCRWHLWGRDGRVLAAVRQLLFRVPPKYCNHKEGQR